MTCDACCLKTDENQFEQRQTSDSREQEAYCVCLACAARGYSERDVRGYPCLDCGMKGHRLFPQTAIQTYNRGQIRAKLICSDCMRRSREIRKQLLQPGSWRCTCRQTRGIRVHRAGNEKCELFPRHAGEKRWPGKDRSVSIDDLALMERCTKRLRQDVAG